MGGDISVGIVTRLQVAHFRI